MSAMRRLVISPRQFDIGIAAAGVVLAALVVWVPGVTVGTPVAGPLWLRLAFPALIGAPLAWRRTAPVAAAAAVLGTMALQGLLTGDSAEGLELIFALSVASYSMAAYSQRWRAWYGLGLMLPLYAVYTVRDRGVRANDQGDVWAAAFFALMVLAWWLLGMFVRHRREVRRGQLRARELEEQMRVAVDQERARLARELHDVISHNLSVVVVQAAGARASGTGDAATLEKIERSGRESLVEMRRLLGILRRERDDDPDLSPQPGIASLDALVSGVRAAGVPVDLAVAGELAQLPRVLDLCAYRIVQESLTNVIKHAGPARVSVSVHCDAQAVTIDVNDDGMGHRDPSGVGHGLVGMRERVALFGGELTAGPRPGHGFAVHARLPRDDASS
jgi:signal transduction histidine kinase